MEGGIIINILKLLGEVEEALQKRLTSSLEKPQDLLVSLKAYRELLEIGELVYIREVLKGDKEPEELPELPELLNGNLRSTELAELEQGGTN